MKKLIVTAALVCAAAMVGCVSVESIQAQIKSGDQTQVADARNKVTEIVTSGHYGSKEFVSADRERCAHMIIDSQHAFEILEKMLKRGRLSGRSDAELLKTVLGKVDKKDAAKVVSFLLSGEIYFDRDNGKDTPLGVAKQYVLASVNALNDKSELLKIQERCNGYRRFGCEKYALLYEINESHAIANRLIAISASQVELGELVEKDLLAEMDGYGLKELVLPRISDNAVLLNLASKVKNDSHFSCKIYAQITDEKALTKFALGIENEMWTSSMSQTGVKAVEKINDKEKLVLVALLAKNEAVVIAAKKKIGDTELMQTALVKLVKAGRIGIDKVNDFVKELKKGEATIDLYDGLADEELKFKIFEKLTPANRASIRARNKSRCERLLADAKQKAVETFELGGFFLGMNISDVDCLVGYYFPDWSNSIGFHDEEKTIRVLFVPNQSLAFCRADKDGKVFEFNFGKAFLKKFYKFDVQNYSEWANAYSKASGFDLRFTQIDRNFTISNAANNFIGGGGGISEYHTRYEQTSYTYKHNAREFRVTYYGDYSVFGGDRFVKTMTWERARYGVGGEPGSLRVKVDND